jgi:hypothetical protein
MNEEHAPLRERSQIFFALVPSPWGRERELVADGRYLCEDASGAWTYDPRSGEVDLVAMGGGTEWYRPAYRRGYVERMIRDEVPFPDWPDPRGRAEWLCMALDEGWPESELS